jgi:hypothetical protein
MNFQPEVHWTASDPARRKEFLNGLKVEEYGAYSVDKSGGGEEGE